MVANSDVAESDLVQRLPACAPVRMITRPSDCTGNPIAELIDGRPCKQVFGNRSSA
jgi:hypothetical protein